jgi:putative ABC transport system substrate-binding protein
MRRRELIAGAGAVAIALTRRGYAQQRETPIVGFVHPASPASREKQVAAFRQGLAETGYIEGKNLAIEYRWAEGHYDRLAELAADLVRRRVTVIVAPTLPSALAAKNATTTTPIVFLIGDDPVKHGFAASLNRPGGNSTGISMLAAGLNAKRFGLLHDLIPSAGQFALLVNPTNPNAASQSEEVRDAARALGRPIEVRQAGTSQEIETVFASLAESRIGGLIIGADPFFNSSREQLVRLAARYAMPTIYEWREFSELGGLASYGTDITDANRQVGIYTGKVLAGTNPADLPVMQPTKFDLVINLKTAKALGLTVPPVLLAEADEVIE